MTILIDIRPLTDKQYSGVAEYTYRLLTALFERDTENQYILFYNAYHDIHSRIPKFDYPNVTIVHKKIPNRILNYPLLWLLHRPRFDRWIKEKVDVFFMPHLNYFAVSKNVKTVMAVHDLSFLVHPEFFSWRKNLWHFFIDVKRLSKRFNRIVAVSEHTKQDLIDVAKVPAQKVKTIYSAIDESFKVIAENDPELLKVKEKLGLAKPFILFLATIEPRKNVEGLCEAFAKLKESGKYPDLQLVLAGGRGWKSKPIFEIIENSFATADIKVLDYVETADRPYLYNLAKVFAYPSFYEGFGLPPLEAMACGTPVVAAASSSLPEIVADAGLLIDPYNVSSIKLGLETVLDNTDLAAELSAKGLSRAKEFSWAKAAEHYIQLFSELK